MTQKTLVAMSHPLTDEQKKGLEGEYMLSNMYETQKMEKLDPNLTSDEIRLYAELLVTEAKMNDCTHVVIQGEPALTHHAWNLAKAEGLTVLHATTHREVKERKLDNGKVEKTSIFHHVQWREILAS